MNKPNITQGEWHVLKSDIVYSSHKGRLICDCERTPHEIRPAPPDEQDKINARFIAAAPKMAEALESLYKLASIQLKQGADMDGLTNCEALAAARSALIAAGYEF